jgi:methyl-accepting chemotaxis protein
MKLSRKMYFGFFLLIILAVIQGLLTMRAMTTLKNKVDNMANEYTPEVVLAGNLRSEIAMAGYFMRVYFVSLDPGQYKSGLEYLASAKDIFGKLEELGRQQTQLDQLGAFLSQIAPSLRRYGELCEAIHVLAEKIRVVRSEDASGFTALTEAKAQLLRSFNEDMVKETADYENDFSRATADQLIRRHQRVIKLNAIEEAAATVSSHMWAAIAASDYAAVGRLAEEVDQAAAAAEILLADTRQQKNIPFAQAIFDSMKTLQSAVNTLYSLGTEMGRLGAERVTVFNALLEQMREMVQDGSQGIHDAAGLVLEGASRDLVLTLSAMLSIVVFGLFASIWLVKSICSPIEKTTSLLGEAITQLNGEATTIHRASEHLSAMSAQQAASLNATSAAIHQVTSMSAKNSENVQRTNEETTQVVRQIEEGSGAVSDMTRAMSEIEDSSGKISLIIKTIEEIAFQTNLLALNAAVEAARAGEAGLGFAVVADEVRNLAQRSAQAAHETTDLIQGTVDRVQRGGKISQRLDEMFRQIENSAQNVGRLIGEITVAINEQNQGVHQISVEIQQIDSATQQNAESVEKVKESAQAIEDEARSLVASKEDLHQLVYGADTYAQAGQIDYAAGSARPPRQLPSS